MARTAKRPARHDVPLDLLGGRTARQFLDEHWQKKPLLVRGAVPEAATVVSPDDLAGLACRDDSKARLVERRRGRYALTEGPLPESIFARLGERDWTLLVQDVNHFVPEADRLLSRFDFVPHARLDDLMVSYAEAGGGVGPHFDSYDVFLIQGLGTRRWQVSAQEDRRLVEGAPLRILRSFRADEEYVVGPGDLLYLPPRLAHFGVALEPCTTLSVGFRALSARELVDRFLGWLPDHLPIDEGQLYEDPDLAPPEHAAEIGADMVARVAAMLSAVRWDEALVGRFLAEYLSEPKPHVVLPRPRRRASLAEFAEAVGARGLALDGRCRMLCFGDRVFVSGEEVRATGRTRALLVQLADARRLPPGAPLDEDTLALLHRFHRDGYLAPLAEETPAASRPAGRRRAPRR